MAFFVLQRREQDVHMNLGTIRVLVNVVAVAGFSGLEHLVQHALLSTVIAGGVVAVRVLKATPADDLFTLETGCDQ